MDRARAERGKSGLGCREGLGQAQGAGGLGRRRRVRERGTAQRMGAEKGVFGELSRPGTPGVGAGLGEGTEADWKALKAVASGLVFDLKAIGRH